MLTTVLGEGIVIIPWYKGGDRVRELGRVGGSGATVKDKQRERES